MNRPRGIDNLYDPRGRRAPLRHRRGEAFNGPGTPRGKLGFVPNVLAAYAFANAGLRAGVTMADEPKLGDSGRSKLERDMIAVGARDPSWPRCPTVHGAALRLRAGDPVLGEPIAPKDRAADPPPGEGDARLCDQAHRRPRTEWRRRTSGAARGRLKRSRQLDIAAVAAFFTASNRLPTATGMRPMDGAARPPWRATPNLRRRGKRRWEKGERAEVGVVDRPAAQPKWPRGP